MPQVSRRLLSKQVEEKLFSLFFKSFTKLSNPSDAQKFLLDLLGPVEQTMLAKRLAIALLLAKGHSYDYIKDTLKVSQETIARVNISLNYKGEGYNMIIEKILKDEKIEDIFNKAEDIAIKALPYSGLKKTLIRNRRSTRKPKTPLG